MKKTKLKFGFYSASILLLVFLTAACSGNNPSQTGCTKEAKQCPDGSYVGRTGPNCEFAPCPAGKVISNFEECAAAGNPVGESYPRQCWTKDGKRFVEQLPKSSGGSGVILGTTSTIDAPVSNTNESGLYNYTDLPLNSLPTTPISIKFLVEHRSALNDQIVSVRGIIITAMLGEAACPSNPGRGLQSEFCAQPRIIIADNSNENRDKNYDLTIFLLNTDDTNYKIGQTVEVKVDIGGFKTGVLATKIY